MSKYTAEQLRNHLESLKNPTCFGESAKTWDIISSYVADLEARESAEPIYMIRVGGSKFWVECSVVDYIAVDEGTFRLHDLLTPAQAEKFYTHPAQTAVVPDIDAMVTRFLSWRLPTDFRPDAGISFTPPTKEYMPHCWPTGTNLLHAGQAKEMVEYMLAAAQPAPAQPSTGWKTGLAALRDRFEAGLVVETEKQPVRYTAQEIREEAKRVFEMEDLRVAPEMLIQAAADLEAPKYAGPVAWAHRVTSDGSDELVVYANRHQVDDNMVPIYIPATDVLLHEDNAMKSEETYEQDKNEAEEAIGRILGTFERAHDVSIEGLSIAQIDATTLDSRGPHYMNRIVLEVARHTQAWAGDTPDAHDSEESL